MREIRMPQLRHIPSVGVGVFITNMAREHGVSFVRTGSDALADVITHLSDDEVFTDETEYLLIALRRYGIIDGPTMVSLLGRYIDQLPRPEGGGACEM